MNYEERLMYVTRNLVTYKQYHQDIVKAARIVRKYFKGKTIEECTKDLEIAVIAYNDGIDFVERNKAEYWKSQKETSVSLEGIERQFCEAHPGLSSGILKPMLHGIFNWYQER